MLLRLLSEELSRQSVAVQVYAAAQRPWQADDARLVMADGCALRLAFCHSSLPATATVRASRRQRTVSCSGGCVM